MKKDFSQPFRQWHTRFYLLIQEEVSGKFLIVRATTEDADMFERVPHVDVVFIPTLSTCYYI